MERDFTEALAVLLQNGSLRDLHAKNPAKAARKLRIVAADKEAFLALSPVELEAQADVLLAKRFDIVRHDFPATVANLGHDALPIFRRSTRTQAYRVSRGWESIAFRDAVQKTKPRALDPLESNRISHFWSGAGMGLYYCSRLPVGGGFRRGLQVIRGRRGRPWKEWYFYFSLRPIPPIEGGKSPS